VNKPSDLQAIDAAVWDRARDRERVLRSLSGRPVSRREMAEAADALGCSVIWLYRLRRRFEADPRTVALTPAPGGRRRGARLLAPGAEAIIAAVIAGFYGSRQKPTLAATVREVARRCREAGLSPPGAETVRRRVRATDQLALARRREGRAAAQARLGPSGGSLEASAPLEIVQVDHTLVDVIVVDPVRRAPIGRPWLTLVVDVHTRMALGFLLSLDPPSQLSTALAIAHAVGSKTAWLAARDVAADWPCAGLFSVLKLDNAAEFHAHALRRACEQYGVTLDHRPPGAPWYGGHVERLMGTLMGLCRLLPGATFADTGTRGVYDSDAMAAMTRAELEAWLAGQIAGVYHNRLHGALGTSPLAAWRAAEAAGWSARLLRDEARLLLDFLPMAQRAPCRDGLRLFNIAYWHERMAVWAAEARMGAGSPRWPVRYDPRDLSQVWLETPDGALERLACKRVDRPPITLWEHRAASAALRAEGRAAVNEEALFAAIEDGRRRVAEAEARSREACRARQRREDAHAGVGEAAARAGEGAAEAGSESERPVPVRIYAAEEW